jgi:16S rRNA (guanine527-N7)-methyltransferase
MTLGVRLTAGDHPDMDGMQDLRAPLKEGLGDMRIDADEPVRESLLAYLALLVRWNATYNLSAIRDRREMLVRHLFDSLSVLPLLHGTRVADIGTGPGLPGIPLALVNANLRVALVESNGKKARFLREAVRTLALADRCEVIQMRAQAYAPESRFDTVVSRAFASLADFVAASRHLLAPGGRWLAMKGRHPDGEIAQLPVDIRIESVVPLAVPGLAGERHAVIMAGPDQGV